MPVPAGWSDANGVLTAPDKKTTVVKGFRAHIIAASTWDASNVPLEAEVPVAQVLLHNLTLGPGTRQCFRDNLLWYTTAKGVVDEQYMGLEIKACYDQILALQAQVALLKANQPTNGGATIDTTQAIADVTAIADGVTAALTAGVMKAILTIKKL